MSKVVLRTKMRTYIHFLIYKYQILKGLKRVSHSRFKGLPN